MRSRKHIAAPRNEPIAIIGIGCRFPGDANDPETFWDVLSRGVDAVSEIPQTRWNVREHYHEVPAPGKTYSKWGGFVKDIEAFDPESFSISPREAACMDPQQRMLLEVTWEALEDAGVPVTSVSGTNTGVFVGISTTDFAYIQTGQPADGYSATGGAASISANRISYWLNSSGPSMAVDTACSSSLVATHLACQSIWSHECELALAGGVNAILSPSAYVAFCAAHMLSPVGRCKAFDASADGFVRAEGAGVAVLKPLSKALEDGDPIYATIAATGINQDGHTSGIALPNQKAQEALIRSVCERAGIGPEHVDYVEAHGTGTSVGDPIEARSLGQALSGQRGPDEFCVLGSVKTNIGHLESAAGIAGLIKAALALKHHQIPPSLHFKEPNPNIPFEELKLRVPTELEPWPQTAHAATVGVNSFGFGGTNAHVLLTECEQTGEPHRTADPGSGPWILPISARTTVALEELARSYREFTGNGGQASLLQDICFTASLKRSHFEHRIAAVAHDQKDLTEQLDAYLKGERRTGMSTGRAAAGQQHRVALVFSGQGPQWWGMGRQLLEYEPVFRSTLEECDALLSEYADWSLLDELSKSEQNSRIQETAIAQPALFALQIGLRKLWGSWGVEPDVVIGHSVGEVAAAYTAGALTLRDAVKVIFYRGYCMDTASSRGRMLAVGLPPEEAKATFRGLEDRVSLAAVNGPAAVALSGDPEILDGISKKLESRGVFARFLQVNYAFHSPQMEPVRRALTSALEGIEARQTLLPMISTVTGCPIDGTELMGEYWWRNVRQTVQFAPAIEQLLNDGYGTFLELSPHPVLSGSITEMLAARDAHGTVVPSLRRREDEPVQMLSSLGRLYTAGYPVDWQRLFPEGGKRVPLPRHRWTRTRYWYETDAERERRMGVHQHPLLGKRQDVTYPLWRTVVDRRVLRYLDGHRVQGQAVFPGAGYTELALAAGHEMLGSGMLLLEEVQIQQALFLPDTGEAPTLEFVYHPEDASYEIHSRATKADPDWLRHVIGYLRQFEDVAPTVDRAQIESRMEEVSPAEYYQFFKTIGLDYGPSFRGVKKLWRGETEALGRIELAEECRTEAGDYRIHPALLDACTQVILGAIRETLGAENLYYLPVYIDKLRFFSCPEDTTVWSHSRLTQFNTNGLQVDIRIFDEAGKVLIEIDGYRCRALERQTARETPLSWLYETRWYEKPLTDRIVAPPMSSVRDIVTSTKRQLTELDRELGWSKIRDRGEVALNSLAAEYVWQALQDLGEPCRAGDAISLRSLIDERGVKARHERLVVRFMSLLERQGFVKQSGPEQWQVCGDVAVRDPGTSWRGVLADHSAMLPELVVLHGFGTHLTSALRGEVDPVELLFPDGSTEMAERKYEFLLPSNTAVELCVRHVVENLGEGRNIRILEVGAGTGGITANILPALPARQTQYVFTDVTRFFLAKAEQKFRAFPFVDFKVLDIEKDPFSQDFEPHSFDIVLASHVFHATQNLRETLTNVSRLMTPGGLLIFLEVEQVAAFTESIFGLMDGWWRFTDHEIRPDHPLIKAFQWKKLLQTVGFTEVEALSLKSNAEERPVVMTARAPLQGQQVSSGTVTGTKGRWLVFADSGGVGDELASLLVDAGGEAALVVRGENFRQAGEQRYEVDPTSLEDLTALCRTVTKASDFRGVVHLWSLDAPAEDQATVSSLEDAERWGCHSLVRIVQALAELEMWGPATQLLCVTRNAQPVGDQIDKLSVLQSPLLGLGRVIRNEHSNINSKLVDLGLDDNPSVDAQRLLRELNTKDPDPEIALRGDVRFVPRAQSLNEKPQSVEWAKHDPVPRFALTIPTPGALDRLQIIKAEIPEVAPGAVEIQVVAAALNFRDVMKALGFYPTDSPDATILGDECAGRITRLGEGVTNLKVGDEVIAVAPGSFASHVVTPATLVTRKPRHLSFPEAVTMPVVFLTAYYGLVHLARLEAGERVLVHAGAGGVGLAAIQLAQHIGAHVYATAGSPEKRQILHQMGVHSVMDSRSLAFADEIMQETGGEGVDVVLNSLSGIAITKGISCLAPNGRFVELGKRDIYQNAKLGLWNFRKNLSYFAVDLGRLLGNAPVLLQALRHEFPRMLRARTFQPLPHCEFPISRSIDGFRRMAQAKHVGKIVLSVRDPRVAVSGEKNCRQELAGDGTYLITGGFGGYGLTVAQWCVDRGAGCVVLMGRHGAASDDAQNAMAQFQQQGARVEEAKGDVTSAQQVAQVCEHIRKTMPPLRGIFHLAMVLEDGILLQQDPDRFSKVTAPKIAGAWNLHHETLQDQLDVFVLFSSVASLLGNPGQSSYAAGGAFPDALAHYRRARGLPAITINWGALEGVGYLAKDEVRSAVIKANRGMLNKGLSPDEAMAALDRAMAENEPQLAALRVDWSTIGKASPRSASVLEFLLPQGAEELESDHAGTSIRESIAEAPDEEKRSLMEGYLRNQVAKVLGTTPEGLDEAQPLNEVGLDSLMGVELKNRVESDLQIALPVATLLQEPSLSQFAEKILTQLFAESGSAPDPISKQETPEETLARVDQLSDEEVDALLLENLEPGSTHER